MDNEQKNTLSYYDLHNVTSQFQNPTMKIISMLDPIAKKLNEHECYDELELINKISSSCYTMLKISFYVSEYRLLINGDANISKSQLNLSDYFTQMMTALKVMLSGTGVTLNADIFQEDIIIETDETYLSRAIFLLIAHGCNNVPDGASVGVSLSLRGDSAVITITDESHTNCAYDVEGFLSSDGSVISGSEDMMMFPIAVEIIKLLGGNVISSQKQDFGNSVTVVLPISTSDTHPTVISAATHRYLTNRYSDMHIIFSGICKPTFF